MSDKLKQIQDALGFSSSPATAAASASQEGSPASVSAATPENVPLDEELEEEFQKHFTYHSFASHPLSKLALVSLGTAAVVAFLVLFYSLFQKPFGDVQSKNTSSSSQSGNTPEMHLFGGSAVQDEEEDTEVRLALSQQADQMKGYQSRKERDIPEQPISVRQSEKLSDKPSKRTVSQASPDNSRRLQRASGSYEQNRPSSRSYHTDSRLEHPSTLPSRSFQAAPRRATPVRSTMPSRFSSPQQKAIDAQARWEELQALGSFKAKESIAKTGGNPIQMVDESVYGGDDEEDIRTHFAARQESDLIHEETHESVPQQKLSGRIEGGILLPVQGRSFSTNGGETEEQSVSIVLEQGITDRYGREVVPSGARLMVGCVNNGPMISFQPLRMAFEVDGQYYEIDLAPGTVSISGEGGPIIASVETVGEDGGGLSVAQLGQLAGALGGLADIEGATDLSLLFNVFGGGGDQSDRSSGIKFYQVEEGTPVTVRITRPLLLPLLERDTPELDFE